MSVADEIKKLSDLLTAGAINQAEFEQGKASVLGATNPSRTPAAPEPRKAMGMPAKIGIAVSLATVAFVGYGFSLSQSPQGKQRASDRQAIEACWQEYKTKARDQEMREFISGACGLLEKTFESTHGIKP